MTMGALRYVLILTSYVVVFWVALPFALWRGAQFADRSLGGLGFDGSTAGWLLVAAGAWVVFASITELWKRGGGVPVSALPPPRLTTRGPYRMVRHPLYFGFNLGVLGLGLAIGSIGLSAVISPLFCVAWTAYARFEERALVRRFGVHYEHYMRTVGLFPRVPFYPLARLAMRAGAFPTRVYDEWRIPGEGGVVIVANHASYLDPLFVGWATDRIKRTARFVATAEVFRNRFSRWIMESIFAAIQVRRYRTDARALREILRYLEAGEIVCIFPEGERAALGSLQPPLPATARLLARLNYPVVPVGLSGSYDVGPRWAGTILRAPVTIRVGPPIDFRSGDPGQLIYSSIRRLLTCDPQPVHKGRLDASRLSLVIWRCPRCLDLEAWNAAALRCGRCLAVWEWLPTGRFRDGARNVQTLAELAGPVWDCPEQGALRVKASGWHERSMQGPIRPLERLGESELYLDQGGLRFRQLFVPLGAIDSITTERSDTLQIATASSMWQFRVAPPHSVFRLQRALWHWQRSMHASSGHAVEARLL